MKVLISFSCLLVIIKAQSTKDYYIGAVVGYTPIVDESKTAGEIIQGNIDEYIKHIESAKKQDADIIVFPEDGLTTTRFVHGVFSYTSEIPNPNDRITPCNNKPWTLTLKRLSCAAQRNQIYVVVNLPERMKRGESDYNLYNTNIVFDRNGTVIARYRKYNLFSENFNITDSPELVSFETDFGVTFGTFTCFDILFPKPSLQLLRENVHITDIVYPTAWFSQLPFLTAVQTQSGWARTNGVNFLAAGYNDPDKSQGGSGIYSADGNITLSYEAQNQTFVLVSKIKKIQKRVNPTKVDSNTAKVTEFIFSANRNTWKANMESYTTERLNDTVLSNYKLCHKKFCCRFTLKFTYQEVVDFNYRVVVFEGSRLFGLVPRQIQICGLIACHNKSIDSCGVQLETYKKSKKFEEISISGIFHWDENSVIFPSNVLYNLSVLPPSAFDFKTNIEKNQNSIEMTSTHSISNLLAFGIYALIDDSNQSNNSALLITVCVIFVIIVAFASLLFARRQLHKNRKNKMNQDYN